MHYARKRKKALANSVHNPMNDVIRIGFRGQPDSFRKIPRPRVVPKHLIKVFKVHIEYLVDKFGEVPVRILCRTLFF